MTLKATCFATLIAALIAGPLFAQEQRAIITPQQMLGLGTTLLEEGRPGEAAAVADLLLQRDPNDLNALIIGARAALAENDPAQAIALSRRAYWGTEDRDALFVAARLAANGHAMLQQDTRSQLWLRRAAQYSPSDEATTAIARDYQSLRQRNPWSTSLRFGVTPTQNLNNGSNVEEQLSFLPFVGPVITSLSAEAQALSGLEFSGGISTRYRINTNQTSATFLDFGLNGRTYALSQESKDAIAADTPDGETPTRGSDFADASITLGVTHRRILSDGARPTTFGLSVTRQKSEYNNEPLRHTLSGYVSQDWSLGETDVLSATVIARKRTNVANDPAVRSFELNTNWRRQLANGDQLSFGAGYARSNSFSFDNDYQSLSLRAGYDFGDSIAGMKFGIGLSGYVRDWEDYPLFALDGRRDRSVTANLRVTFEEIEFYGFQPVATLEASRSRSNVDRYDTDGLRLGFDLQSSF